ncbi:MAG TPA: CCA tRNA nucleotidyltransferase [Nitrososphaerales archaeon]|nr:CCA tRNA nucleotidyltransferase [Nitrososphaerales archaeon]
MTGVNSILAGAAKLVVPSATETAKVESVAESTLSRTNAAASRFPQTRGAILGGSFAKGTWIPKHADLDIFVKFDVGTPLADFERIGLEVGARATRGYPRGKMYAQHPYTEAAIDGIKVNIVPCFDVVKGEWKSAADRSPFHVELVRGLTQEQKTQVRMLKSFMNGVGVYGAEIERRGFSGYVAEVLVMKRGGFQDVLKWFAAYELPGDGKAFTLPDPVDEKRDLGIAVSGESLGRMVLASRGFLSTPTMAYFRRMSGRERPSLRREVVAVLFSHKPLSEDTLWGELRRTTRHVVRNLEVRGFVIARSMAASDNRSSSAILLVPESTTLPQTEQRVGPTVDRRKDLASFIAANSKGSKLLWVDDDARVRMLIPRKYTELSLTISDLAKGKAGPVGASRELEAGMKKGVRVLSGKSLARAASSAGWLQDGIREITTDAIGAS